MISDSALSQLKADHPCADVAQRFGVRLRRHGQEMIGPCPLCSRDRQSKRDMRFAIKNGDGWVCAACQSGGDVIALVQKVEGLDFKGAVEWLGGVRETDPAESARREKERAAKEAKREKDAQAYRERERGTLYDIWNGALAPEGTAVEAYLAARRLPLPPEAHKRLRCVAAMPYFSHGGKNADIIHRGPAMVAPIVGPDGIFRGLHFTYVDLDQPKGKARIIDPETGEPLPSKKVRGSKAGGVIRLVKAEPMTRLIMGEGIETVLSVWHALASLGRDLSGVAFWSSVDLGNVGGKAASTVLHPTLKDAARRSRRVPGPEPDLSLPAIEIPPYLDVVLLGDGDSDALVTECALRRGAARWCSARSVRVGWAPKGRDFNDLLLEAA
jgi:hypothetical protein